MNESWNHCLIWPGCGEDAQEIPIGTRVMSERAGGGYVVVQEVAPFIQQELDDPSRARLTTWLIDQRQQTGDHPVINRDVLEHVKSKRPLPVAERADRILKFLADRSEIIGFQVFIGEGDWNNVGEFVVSPNSKSVHNVLALSESTHWDEVRFLINYLESQGWIVRSQVAPEYVQCIQCIVTVVGHSRVAKLYSRVASAQAFVAMWFDHSMTEAYENGFVPAIRDAGYDPFIINRADFLDKIDDRIIAEIRRSKFLVADFTHGHNGARGSVYYEAGFAQGLGLPVIFTCHANFITKLHFDTNHYPHIKWTDTETLRKQLYDRIRAVIL